MTAKDIYNVKTKLRQMAKGDDPMYAVTELFKAMPGSTLKLPHNDNGIVNTNCFQSPHMRLMYAACGDTLIDTLIYDAMYKVNNYNMPLYLPLVVDSNGRSQIVGVFLACSEEAATLGQIGSSFSKQCKWPLAATMEWLDKYNEPPR